jgi:Mannosyltransferase (PIG-V)
MGVSPQSVTVRCLVMVRRPTMDLRKGRRLAVAPGHTWVRRFSVNPAGLLAVSLFMLVRGLVLAVVLLVADYQGRSGLRLLVKWDAQWYAGIARSGYGFVRIHEDGRHLSDYAFFPLYPLTERIVAETLGVAYVSAGLVISGITSIVAAAGVYAVAQRVLTVPAAVIATVLWAALPMSVVQSMAYSESLFTALAAWCLHSILQERWLTAALLACASGLTRPIGVAVVAAVMVTAVTPYARRMRLSWPLRIRPLLSRRLAATVLAPMGLLGYLVWVALDRGQGRGYFDVTRAWGNEFDAGVAFTHWIGAQLAGRPVGGIAIVLGLVVLATLCWACVRNRLPLPLLVYTFVLVAVSLTTSGYFGSKPRYLLPAFPLLFPVAGWLARRHSRVIAAVLAGCTLGAAAYAPIWLSGPGPP